MQIIEIAPRDWTAALNRFAVAHDGWLVSLEVFTPEYGAQVAFQNMPLLSMATDQSRGSIYVSAEQPGGYSCSHAVAHPKRLCIERSDEGADRAVLIEDSSGELAIVSLKWPSSRRDPL
jgi:hypothetical protein